MTSLFSYLTPKEMPLIRHHENQTRRCVGSQPGTQVAFRNVSKGECYYRAKKHFKEALILPELLLDNLSDVPEDIFSENDDFVRETKIVPREKIQ
jgi:hypothetical protein